MKALNTGALVLGGGLSGWFAARELVNAGRQVVMLRDGAGASAWVHGLCAPVAPEDSPELFLRDTLKSGQGLSRQSLAEALCGDAREMLRQVEEMGLSFNQDENGYQLLRPLGCSQPRVLSIGNQTGVALMKALEKQLSGRMRILDGVRAVELIQQDGRVRGALAYDRTKDEWLTIGAQAVVLASGGYCGIYPCSTNKRDSGGDGAAMAWRVGAALCDMEFIQFEPSGSVWPPQLNGTSMITTLFFEGAVLRNGAGERFMLRYGEQGERVGKDVLAQRIAREIAEGRGSAHGGVYFDATQVGRERLESGYGDYVKRYRQVGIDLASEWIELAPMPHTALGGVSIDEWGCTTVSGLYACGEVCGGLHGANRLGGNAGLETLVFGRRAGLAAAQAVSGVSQAASAEMRQGERSCAQEIEKGRALLREELSAAAGVLRDGARLSQAVERLQTTLHALNELSGANAREEFDRRRLVNDLTAGCLTCRAALARTDSLGCHQRADEAHTAQRPYRLEIVGEQVLRKHL